MSAALLAGAVSFSSCSNDEDGAKVSYGNGENAEAQMAISFQRFAKAGRGTVGDANLDADGNAQLVQPIEAFAIMPGNGTTYLNAIKMGSLTLDSETGKLVAGGGLAEKEEGEYFTKNTISLAEGTSQVKFFGGDVWEGTGLKATVAYPELANGVDVPEAQVQKKYWGMPNLYYYGEDKQLESSQQVYGSVVNWDNVPAGGLKAEQNVKSIRVNDIEYAVGVLHSTVKMAAAAKHLFVDDNYTGNITDKDGVLQVETGDDRTPADMDNAIQIVGYIINGQQASVGVVGGFKPSSTEGTTTVYDPVETVAGITTIATATNYTRLFATPASQEKMVVTLRCKNNSGYSLVSRNVWDETSQTYQLGLIPSGAEFYLPVTLKIGNQNEGTSAPSLIAQDYNTKANFTINSTYNAYNVDPEVKTIDATVGVVVDLEWKAGYVFDEAIQ